MIEGRTCNYVKITANEKKLDNLQEIQAEYVRAEIYPEDELHKRILHKNGYIWVDRTIKAQINLNHLGSELTRLIRMDIKELDGITDEVYEVAVRAFKNDRRFFLSLDSNAEVGHCVLWDFIKQCSERKCMLFGCFYDDKMVGALIVEKINNNTYETLLGAVLPEWQSKGAGCSLYAYEFHALKEKGAKILYSRISTDNLSSLNLHLSLSKGNISFTQPLDVYLKCQEKK